MKLPQDEHDGELPLDHVLKVLTHFGVDVRRNGRAMYLRKGDVIVAMPPVDPVPRGVVAWLARTYDIDGLHFYFFGRTEPGLPPNI